MSCALALGADDYLEKPCHPDRLLARTKRLLEQFAPLKNTIRTDRLALDLDTYKLSWRNST